MRFGAGAASQVAGVCRHKLQFVWQPQRAAKLPRSAQTIQAAVYFAPQGVWRKTKHLTSRFLHHIRQKSSVKKPRRVKDYLDFAIGFRFQTAE
jgi:hypothetical protein